MRFLHGKVKGHAGERISITFSQPTRVLIMPERQFEKYRNNLTFTYFGGHKESPYEFTFPKSGNWIVGIEKGTYHNPIDLKASISKISPDPMLAEAPKSKKKKKKKKEKEEAPAEVEANADSGEETKEEPAEQSFR